MGRKYYPYIRPVYTGVQNDTRIYGPYMWAHFFALFAPVYTARVYG